MDASCSPPAVPQEGYMDASCSLPVWKRRLVSQGGHMTHPDPFLNGKNA
jgi:hypothetical protein